MVETIAIEQKKNIFLSSSNLIKIRDDSVLLLLAYSENSKEVQCNTRQNKQRQLHKYLQHYPASWNRKTMDNGTPFVNDDGWVFPRKISLLQTWFLSRSLRGALRRTIITSKVAKSKGKAVAAKWIKRKSHHWRSDCHVPSQWFSFWQLTKLPSFCR